MTPTPGGSAPEQEFDLAMKEIYRQAKSEVGYNATRFIQMVAERGGVGAARHLIQAPTPSEGVTTLVMARRLDLTVEDHVLRLEFASLFTDNERRVAQQRLDNVKRPPQRIPDLCQVPSIQGSFGRSRTTRGHPLTGSPNPTRGRANR
jgi:hypothetical protein